jgi:class 3 adenylate cyclase/tetratricopeptide (TPR) repeat protein
MLDCSVCRQENPDFARFCLACGASLPTVATPPAEERKIVTVLFCDLVGFTTRSEYADPEDVRATLRLYHSCVSREIERLGGTIEKFIGDAVMAVFGAPVAHEDDAERAVRSALRILDALQTLNQTSPDLDLAVRIGINTGETVVTLAAPAGEHEGLVAGDVVNTASRLETAAPIGGVVVGEATYRATKSVFEYEQLAPVKAKGKAKPLSIWQATKARGRYGADVDSQAPTPFMGREDEFEVLTRAYVRALREGSIHLITLLGEPGVGKTRLVKEFFAYVDRRPEIVFWRIGRCLPYGDGITFWPLGEIVKAHAGILESDGPREAAASLNLTLETLVGDASEREWIRGRLAPLVGLSSGELAGATERVESFTAWRRFLEAMAIKHPLVLVFEDLHWADSAMLDFLDHLVDWSNDVPILVVCTARPELYERRPGWGGGKRNSTAISLSPLTDEIIWEIISALLPRSDLPVEIHELVLERAGGNPLYAEEFVRMLMDAEPMRVEQDRLGLPGMPFPESIQAIIAARIDGLAPDQKALMQDASVVGKVFWSGALSFMAGLDEVEVLKGLHELARKELVRPARTSSMKGQWEYTFWHSLIRDVAYSQIPRASRATKHIRVGEWTEELAGERVADHAEVLAYHYRQALDLARATGEGDLIDLERDTRRFLVMAGDRALGLDVEKAAIHYKEVLRLLPPGHLERAAVQVKAAEAAGRVGRFAEAEGKYGEAIADLRAQGNLRGAGQAMVKLSVLLWRGGKTAESRRILGQAIELLEREPPGPELAQAYAELAADKVVLGLFDGALQWSKKALALSEMLGAEELMPSALSAQGIARWYLGDASGIDDLQKALDLSVSLGLGRETARVQAVLAELLWVTAGPSIAIETSEKGIELAERRGNADLAMAIRAQTLGPLFDTGRWDDLLALADELAAWSHTTGEGYFSIHAESFQAHVMLCRGQLEQAGSLSARILPAAREVADPQVLVSALAVAALIEAGHHDLAGAARLVLELEEVTRGRPGWYRAHYLPDVIEICVAAGDVSLPERLTRDMPVHAARHKLSLLTVEAILAEARGDLEEASRTYAEAADRWRAFGSVPARGRALLGAGRCSQRLGKPDAAAFLEEARNAFLGLGARPWLAEADAWLKAAPTRIS